MRIGPILVRSWHRVTITSRHLAWACLLFGSLGSLGVMALDTPAWTEPASEEIATENVAELTSQFRDRYINGLEFAGRRGAAGARDSTIWFAPDGLHLAFLHETPTGVTVVVDGVPGNEYQHARGFGFSQQGGHYAYLAGPFARGDLAVVHDGREYPVEDEIEIVSPLQLSANGMHFAYVGVTRSKFRPTAMCVVTDRMRSRAYDQVSIPRLSWDGAHVGFLARRLGRYVVVIDGTESPEYQWAGEPIFDLESRHVLYTYFDDGRYRLLRDGERVEGYECGPDFVTSRDGSHIGCVVQTRHGECLTVDGELGEEWNAVAIDTTLFGLGGDRIAYWGQRGGTWTLVLDRQRVFEQRPGQGPARIQFSTDRDQFAYVDRQSWSRRVILDGVPGRDYDAVGEPRFAPRGARNAYAARRGDRERMVVDGVEGPEFEAVGDPVFSPDGEHVAHVAWKAKDRACVVVDGRSGPEFEVIVPNGPYYLPDGTLEYLAIRESTLLRVSRAPSVVTQK
jgi:hypothetical protein